MKRGQLIKIMTKNLQVKLQFRDFFFTSSEPNYHIQYYVVQELFKVSKIHTYAYVCSSRRFLQFKIQSQLTLKFKLRESPPYIFFKDPEKLDAFARWNVKHFK